ncbi:hypothetical protein [Ruania alba]|uniref:Uncharacterized protein n=1 Tax=Ruania alba TaxID=648782 RepID=A0A1H5BRN7_9MICO|nr:hypothetical protein [Ruania alba]SED56948.1 hypothetical protein SAMN04488554_0172 [Ruania alba]
MTTDGDAPQEPSEPEGTSEDPAAARPARTARWRVIALGGVVLVLLIVLAVLLVPRLAGDGPARSTAEPVAKPTPEPTAPDPIDRDTSTPLLEALPDQVDGYAVTAQEEVDPLDQDALETWQLTYTDAEDSVTLQLAQWEEAEEATEVFTDLTDGVDPVESGAVQVDGSDAGQYVVAETDDGARATWTNATVVLIVNGPDVETVTAFYLAYPL